MASGACSVRLAAVSSLGENEVSLPKIAFVAKAANEEGRLTVLGHIAPAAVSNTLLGAIKYLGDPGKVHIHYDNALLVTVGIGDPATLKEETIRRATHAGLEKVRELKESKAFIALPSKNELAVDYDVAVIVAETVPMSNYCWQGYVTDPKRRKTMLTSVVIGTVDGEDDESRQRAVERAVTVSQCVCYARDLGNERTNRARCEYYEEEAVALGQAHETVKVQVVQYEEMCNLGMGLICAVGQGARGKPRLILLDYRGGGDSDGYVCLVGKGIVFDTGGYNLKPTGSMETMYLDMCGSAAVLATMKAVAELGTVKANVLGVMCMAENAIGNDSYHPSCILHSLEGLTVEVSNTDCEGRLVLADGMTYAQRYRNVTTLIDLATLTGCNKVALGESTAGLYGNNQQLLDTVKAAAAHVGESVWHLPIFDEHRDDIRGAHSDLKNKGSRYGGGCNAAAFLERFVANGVAWAHLDIYGPATYTKDRWYLPDGATGFGVRTLCAYLGAI